MSHESCDTKYESHRVKVERRTHYKKGHWPPRSWVLHATIYVTFYTYTLHYQSKLFIYHVTRHKDKSDFHELCGQYCLTGVRVLSYRSTELKFKSDRLVS